MSKQDTKKHHLEEENPMKKRKKTDEKTALLEEVREWNDKYLRLYSEFDNYRKRTAKEKIEFTKVATEALVKELLPVLDDFDRALDNIPAETEDEHTKELYNGVSLIHQKFFNTLKKKELTPIEVAIGSDFDLNFQEAIATIPAPSEELKGKVIDVVEKGYMLGDAIIRFSKVVVGQ
ncbi:MAG: nucleotide exchange factor GrpE [Bacteroidales bacterium]|nr:nucleotide exchange factor GrpE [Bacteroidales bacterium]